MLRDNRLENDCRQEKTGKEDRKRVRELLVSKGRNSCRVERDGAKKEKEEKEKCWRKGKRKRGGEIRF